MLLTFQFSAQLYANETNIGDKVYLNACGGNSQDYKTTLKVITGLIEEVPNLVTSTKTSPHGRPFTSMSSSTISVGGKLTAKLSNFREIEVSDENNTLFV